MLIVPPSIISSSCWFSVSLVMGDWVDCASETNPWRGWACTPSPLTEIGTFACRGMGRGNPLFANSGCRSIGLQVISLLGSDSTGFWVLVSMVGVIETLFSSNFPGKVVPRPEPFFMVWGWPTKFWTRQWLFLCLKQVSEQVNSDNNFNKKTSILFKSNASFDSSSSPGRFHQRWTEPIINQILAHHLNQSMNMLCYSIFQNQTNTE